MAITMTASISIYLAAAAAAIANEEDAGWIDTTASRHLAYMAGATGLAALHVYPPLLRAEHGSSLFPCLQQQQ